MKIIRVTSSVYGEFSMHQTPDHTTQMYLIPTVTPGGRHTHRYVPTFWIGKLRLSTFINKGGVTGIHMGKHLAAMILNSKGKNENI